MNKKIALLLILITYVFVVSGCADKSAVEAGRDDIAPAVQSSNAQGAPAVDDAQLESESDIVDIKEKMFITQINDIYLNPEDYMDKKIRLEGYHSVYEVDGKTLHGVIRNGPGCCGNDGVAGFEFVMNGEYPKANDWLRITGSIEVVKDKDTEYIRLNAEKVDILEERGADFVAN